MTQSVRPDLDASVEALVRAHLPLVGHIVREALTRVPAHIVRDDLMSAGLYALAAAATSFDDAHGVPFAHFAAIRIRGAIADELRGRDWASRSVRGKARAAERARAELTTALHRTPTRAETARTMGVTTAELDAIDADAARAGVLSLQELTTDDGGSLPTAGDQPELLLLDRERLGYLRDAIAELPHRLQVVVRGHFFEQRRLLDIAAELGVTESRVSQLRSEALALLRVGMRAADANDAGSPADPPREAAPCRRPATAGRTNYYAAVAARSSLAARLDATTLLGEPLTPAGA